MNIQELIAATLAATPTTNYAAAEEFSNKYPYTTRAMQDFILSTDESFKACLDAKYKFWKKHYANVMRTRAKRMFRELMFAFVFDKICERTSPIAVYHATFCAIYKKWKKIFPNWQEVYLPLDMIFESPNGIEEVKIALDPDVWFNVA